MVSSVLKGRIPEREFRRINAVRSIIFFFNVFLSFMIITGSYLLMKIDAGKISLLLGFFMLVLSVSLRVLKKW